LLWECEHAISTQTHTQTLHCTATQDYNKTHSSEHNLRQANESTTHKQTELTLSNAVTAGFSEYIYIYKTVVNSAFNLMWCKRLYVAEERFSQLWTQTEGVT